MTIAESLTAVPTTPREEITPTPLRTRQRASTRPSLRIVEPSYPQTPEDPIPAYTEYLRRRRMSAKTIQLRVGWIHRFRRWLESERPHLDLFTVTYDDIEDYAFSKDTWSRATSATLVASLRVFYRWAHREGYVPGPLADDLAPVRQDSPHGRTVTDDIVRDALARASLTERAMLLLGAECGLRVAEIAKVKVEDRDGGWLTVIGKGSKRRKVYMSDRLQATLDEIEHTGPTTGGWYFPGVDRRGPVVPSTVWQRVRRLTGVNTHALRHRAGTAVYQRSGHDLRLTQEFLGHSSPITTAIYVHVEDDELLKAGRYAAL